MGAGNSKESLHDAINAENTSVITQILKQFPEIINEPVSEQNPTTPLGRAAWRGNVELLYTLLEHGADVNFVGPQGVSPLQWASQRGKDEAVDFLVQKGAKLDYISKDNMNALDYSILYGSYNTAWKLMNLGLNPRDVDYYVAMAKEKHVLFHDYALMIEHLNLKTPLEECPPFDQAPPEPQMKDPVIDPRETWGQFAKRILEFEEPPLVERDSLPEELRPENRALGRLRSYLNGLSPYPEEQRIERADVAEANQDDNISDPKHIEVDIPKEKVKGDDHVEKKDFDDNSVNLKVDEDDGNKTIERAFHPEAEPESAVRKESDIPNHSADVLIKPLQATQIRVGGSKKNLHESVDGEKQENQIEVVDS